MVKVFSFNGRINRGEYAASIALYVVVYVVVRILTARGGDSGGIYGLILIPFIWFLWAQSAKRCHDINKSGWWQIIPFYFIVLLSRKGDPWANEYDIPGEPYYGADDYEKPFTIDEETQPAISPAVTPGNTETPIP